MVDLGRFIAREVSALGEPPSVLVELFGDDVGRLSAELGASCRVLLGEGIREPLFLHVSVGVTFGAELTDGRRVVLKLHPRATEDFLDGVQRIQGHLRAAGFAAPQPLGVLSRERIIVSAESFELGGEQVDGHEPAHRRALAAGLAQLVEFAWGRVLDARLRTNPMSLPAGELFPAPHDSRFDFSLSEGEWIDAIARRALEARADHGREVVGHSDWRVEHVRLDGDRVSAVYDWDSLVVAREPVVAGQAALVFTIAHNTKAGPTWPTLDESLAFIADYEAARADGGFTDIERRPAHAAMVWMAAYFARCEVSDERAGERRSDARDFLRDNAGALLGHAACGRSSQAPRD